MVLLCFTVYSNRKLETKRGEKEMKMFKRDLFPETCAAVIVAVVTALVLVCGSASPAFAQSLNLVYVNSNISGANGACTSNCNSVVGYSNDGAGNLTLLPNAPYLTGGAGVAWTPGQPDALVDADQELIVNAAGTLLLTVNAHSNTFAVFTINSDGSLTAVNGSPFASGGQEPISLGLANNVLNGNVSMLVVVNKNSDPLQTGGVPNYTTFRVSSTGAVSTNPSGSTFNLAAGVSPAQALMPHAGRNFVGVEFNSGNVAAYSFSTAGVITQQSTSTPTGSTQVLGAALHPKLGGFYVALPTQAKIAVYGWSSSAGLLGYKAEVVSPGKAPCWSVINSAGTRLYVANTPASTITVYDISNPASPKQLQYFTVTGVGALPTNMAFDTTGNYLYATDRVNVLHVMNVLSDGTLSETITPVALPTPAGSAPVGIATLSK